MKPAKPPALATWLVEHLNPGSCNEALIGDLLEQFSQGRSVTWYWRQVLFVILLGFLKEWRILLTAAMITSGWAFPLYYGHLWLACLPGPSFHLVTGMAWLAGLMYATTGFTLLAIGPVCFSSAIYFAMTLRGRIKKRSPRTFWLALLKGHLVVALSVLLLLMVLPVRRDPESVGNIVGTLPVCLGIVVALWTMRQYKTDSHSVEFSRIDPPTSW